MPTLDARFYLNLAIAVVLAVGLWAIHHHGYNQGKAEVQAVFDSYLANERTLIEKAQNEKIAIEARQEKLAKDALTEYNGVVDQFNAAVDDTERVRVATSMLCRKEQPAVPVAEHPGSAVPEASANSERAIATADIRAGTFSLSEFYQAALRDTAQCKALIDLVKTTQ